MLALALSTLLLAAPGSVSPDRDPYAPEPPLDAPGDRRDPCRGREGWVGDGDDGRDPPACEERDARGDDDPAGLHEPDWLRSGDGGDDGGP